MEQSKSCARSDYMRSVALSVYSQCRRVMQHMSNVKALTGFGPAATGDLFLKNKDVSAQFLYVSDGSGLLPICIFHNDYSVDL